MSPKINLYSLHNADPPQGSRRLISVYFQYHVLFFNNCYYYQLIDSAKELLEVDNQIAPVTILGVRASVALISSLFTLSGSVVTFALQSYKSK